MQSERENGQAAFLKQLRKLIIDDNNARLARLSTIWNQDLEERVNKGQAVERVTVVGRGRSGGVHVEWPENNSLFRDGDILCLHRGKQREHPSCMAVLEYEDDHQAFLNPLSSFSAEDAARTQPEGWILDFGYFDLSERYLQALTRAAQTSTGRESVLPMLMNRVKPLQDPGLREKAEALADTLPLNWSQKEAFASAFAADNYYLIQGPPGTGKTHVLANIVKALVDMGQTVLVTALTHRAINNALNKVRSVCGERFDVCKVGVEIQAGDLAGISNFESFADSPFAERLSGGYAVGATPFGARSSRLSDTYFDVVIFDEASQITLPLAIMAMLSGGRYVFIGDDRQLPPVFSSCLAEPELTKSVFDILLAGSGVTMLNETYRLNKRLAAWPSASFYGGELEPHRVAANRRLQLTRPSEKYAGILEPAKPSVFVRVPASAYLTTRNQKEAELAADLIAELLACGVPPTEVAVVTPFRGQGRLIRNLLRRNPHTASIARKVVVDTVERMQGQERDVIIFSLVSTNIEFVRRLAEFYLDPRRLNVSITRARSKLIILSGLNFSLVAENCGGEEAALWEKFINSCDWVDL